MFRMPDVGIAVGLVLAAGCHSQPLSSNSESSQETTASHSDPLSNRSRAASFSPHRHHHDGLLALTVTGPDHPSPHSDLELDLSLESFRSDLRDVSLRIELPAGVTVVDSSLHEVVALRLGTPIDKRIRIRVSDLPSGDLKVLASMEGLGFGAHATAAYRFGRPEPKLPQPLDRSESLNLNGQRVRTILLSPSSQRE